MSVNNKSVLKIFCMSAALLLVLSFFSGCVQDSATQNAPPIDVTIHSSYKTTEIRDVQAKPGTVFVVVNMTIENRGGTDHIFNEKSVSITDGAPVEEKLYTRLTDRRYWGPIPPNEKRTGEIIFATQESTQDLTLRFFYQKGQNSFTQELGKVPLSGSSSETLPGAGGNNPESDNTKPINVTIHSALQTMNANGGTPNPGYIFVIINMTIENLDTSREFLVNENTVKITGGGSLNQKMSGYLKNPILWGSIPPRQMRTGEIIYGVKESTPSFTLTFLSDNDAVALTQTVGNIPVSTYSSETLQDAGGNNPESDNTKPINVTIHSALQTMNANGGTPNPGYIFVIINMTIENLDTSREFLVNENTVKITGGGSLNQKMSGYLKNPILWGSIPPRQMRTGEIIYGVKESTPSFTLTFLSDNDAVALTQTVGNIPVSTYSSSIVDPASTVNAAVLESENFAYVVENLDTPAKAAQYMHEKFSYLEIGKCTSDPPQVFFERRTGDCKHYATFLSYVLAEHGYDAKIIAFSYYIDGKRNGHVVTLFTDSDGKMKYATTPDVTIFREVSSVDDLLAKECTRLGTPSIANYLIKPAGSLDACVV
jgi:hypothetical protein